MRLSTPTKAHSTGCGGEYKYNIPRYPIYSPLAIAILFENLETPACLNLFQPLERLMKSQGEVEAAICAGITQFEQEYMGRGPKDIHTYLLDDLVVIRLHGVLTAAEQQLVKTLAGEKGRDLLKQVRTHLVETARPVMEAMIFEATGVKVVSLHHDISTITGEEVILFALAEAPSFRNTKKK